MAADLAELRALVSADTASFMRGMDNVDKRMGKTQGAMKTVGSAGARMGKTVAIGALAIGGGMALAGGFIGKVGLDMAMLKQRSMIAFTTMLGSGQKATQMMNNLQKFAATTPFEFKELIPASQKLLAMGFAARDVVPMLTDIGDAAAGLGLGSEGVDRITLALGQMQAKGKVAGGEMMQLTEAGIPAWKYLAQATGKSTAEVMKMSEKGLLPANMAIKAIRDGMRGDFGGMMAKQSKTLDGQLSNLKDAFINVSGNIVGKFVPGLTKAADSMNKWLSGKSGQAFLNELTAGAGKFASAFGTAIGFVVGHWDKIKSVAGTVAGAVVSAVSTMAGVIGPVLGQALDFIQQHWDQIKQGAATAFQGAQNVATTLAGVLTGTVIPAVQEIAGALAPAGAAFMSFGQTLLTNVVPAAKTFYGLIQQHQGTVEAIAAAVLAMGAAFLVVSAAQAVATATTTAWAAAMAILDAVMAVNPFVALAIAIVGVVAAIVVLWKRNEAFRGAILGAWGAIRGAVTGAVGAVRGAISGVAGAFSSMTGAVSSAVGAVVSVISGLGSKVLGGLRKAFQIYWTPYAIMAGLGRKAVEGVISGLASLGGRIMSAVRSAFAAVTGFFNFPTPHISMGSQHVGVGPLGVDVPYPTGISFGADGGVFGGSGGLAMIGEAGREFAIPMTRNRSGALALWAQAGKELGVPGLANGGVAGAPPGDPGVGSPFNAARWAKGHTLSGLYQLESDYEANTRRWSTFYQRSGGTTDPGESRALAGRVGVTQGMLQEIASVRVADTRKMNTAKSLLRRRQASLRAAQHAAGRKGLSKSAKATAEARVKRAQRGVDAAQKRVDYWGNQLGSGSDAHGLLQQGYDLEQDRQGYLADAIPPPPPTPEPADTGGGGAVSTAVDPGAGVSLGGSSGGSGGVSGGGGSGGGGGPTFITIDMRGAVVTVDDFVAQVREKLAAYGKTNGSIFGNVQADTVPR